MVLGLVMIGFQQSVGFKYVDRLIVFYAAICKRKCEQMDKSGRTSIRNELTSYKEDIIGESFTTAEGRKYCTRTQKEGKLMRLAKLARLFHTAPTSAIPQERQFRN